MAILLAFDERESHGARRTNNDESARERDDQGNHIECERLFLITPRRKLLASEEKSGVPFGDRLFQKSTWALYAAVAAEGGF